MLEARRPAPGLIFHSDRGSQYASTAYRAELEAHGMLARMSGRGNCYDNAVAERFFATLEFELIRRSDWRTRGEARRAIFRSRTCQRFRGKFMKSLFTILLFSCSLSAFAQNSPLEDKDVEVEHQWRVSTPYFVVTDPIGGHWNDRTSTQMIEFHVKRKLDDKNIVGVKFATWRLFQPMGITWWDGLLDKIKSGSEFYDGYLRETGVGVTYQRMLSKGLFASIEVLPQIQTYTDLDGNKIRNGFKVYNSFHLGYHLSIGKKERFFIEPQVHVNQWMFDNNSPEGFKEFDDKYGNIFLFEPNIYLGWKF